MEVAMGLSKLSQNSFSFTIGGKVPLIYIYYSVTFPTSSIMPLSCKTQMHIQVANFFQSLSNLE